MVPRAVAVLASYDAERRYVPDPERALRYEAQLPSVTGTSHSLFALLPPSAALAEAGDPLRYPSGDAQSLLHSIQARLRPEVERLTCNAPTEGLPQGIWYAVMPLLLERKAGDCATWLQDPPSATDTGEHTEDGEATAWLNLKARVKAGLARPHAPGTSSTGSSRCDGRARGRISCERGTPSPVTRYVNVSHRRCIESRGDKGGSCLPNTLSNTYGRRAASERVRACRAGGCGRRRILAAGPRPWA